MENNDPSWRVDDKTIVVKGIDYPLSLYHSYLLPLLSIRREHRWFVFEKTHGVCKGLLCRYDKEALELRCTIPDTCTSNYAFHLLGITTYKRVWRRRSLAPDVLRSSILFDCIKKITIPFSPQDKYYVITAIILSKNTDYYINTLRWMDELINKGVVISRSYQVKQFLKIKQRIKKILSRDKEPLIEAAELLSLKGIGVKSVHAYLLHAYGLTRYAPIDRYFSEYLRHLGIKGRLPCKKLCIDSRLNCSRCRYSGECIYAQVQRLFGGLTGIIQSIIYCLFRTKNTIRRRENRVEDTLRNFSEYLEHPSLCLRI